MQEILEPFFSKDIFTKLHLKMSVLLATFSAGHFTVINYNITKWKTGRVCVCARTPHVEVFLKDLQELDYDDQSIILLLLEEFSY